MVVGTDEVCDDVWLIVFSFLSYSDVASVLQVNRRFYQICQESTLWKSLFLKQMPIPTENIEKAKTCPAHRLKEITKDYHSVPTTLVRTIAIHKDEVLHGCWSNDGSLYASASRDRFCFVLNRANMTGEQTNALQSLRRSCDNAANQDDNNNDNNNVNNHNNTVHHTNLNLTIPNNNNGNSESPESVVVEFYLKHQQDIGRVGFSKDNKYLFTSTVATMEDRTEFRGWVCITRVSDLVTICTVENASFDNFPAWLTSSRFIFSNMFYKSHNDYVQEFCVVDCDTIEHNDDELPNMAPAPLTRFRISNENCNNYFHLATASGDGKKLAVTTGKSMFSAEEICVYNVPEEATSSEPMEDNNSSDRGDFFMPSLKAEAKYKEKGSILGLSISADNRYLLCSVRKFTDENAEPTMFQEAACPIKNEVELHVYDLQTHQQIQTLRGCVAHTSADAPFLILGEISPDGKYIACGCEDKVLRIWDFEFGILLVELRHHQNVVNFVNWHPHENILVSGSDDFNLNVYKFSTRSQ